MLAAGLLDTSFEEFKRFSKALFRSKIYPQKNEIYFQESKRRSWKRKIVALVDLIAKRKYHGTEVPKFVKSICRKHREDLFRFADNPEIEPTNNLAERGLRHAVVMRKISGGSRSKKGAETTAKLLSIMQTMKMQEGNIIENMVDLLHKAK